MLERIESKINRDGPNGCWLWKGCQNGTGYGVAIVKRRNVLAHRYVYEQLKGPITEATLDHLCRVTLCVNPMHLEPVSVRENIRRGNGMSARHARKTHCIYGHEFTIENTYIRKTRNGIGRTCKICQKRRNKEVLDRAAQIK